LLVSSVLYWVSAGFAIERSGERVPLLGVILAFGVLFRLTVLLAPPALSHDLYRYQWEGQVQSLGLNPYAVTPERIPSPLPIPAPNVPAGYGPLWELVEKLAFQMLPSGIFWWKLPACLADLAILPALLGLLRSYGVPASRLIWYAWCPLPLVEFWSSGHNDSWVVLCLVLALWGAKRDRWTAAFAALTCAALVKYWPLLLFPAFLLSKPPAIRRWQWLVGPAIAAPFVVLYWGFPVGNIRYLSGFLGGWRNNDSLFGGLLWLTGSGDHAGYMVMALLVLISVAVVRLKLEQAVQTVVVALILLASSIHPWYLTWLLPVLVLHPWRPLVAFVGLCPVFYTVLIDYRATGAWQGVRPERWFVYAPVFVLMAIGLFEHGYRPLRTPNKRSP